jgi:selenoprotein W-related protein
LADVIVNRFRPQVSRPHPIERVELVPSGGGVFEVKADGRTIFSKKQAGRHAEPEEVVSVIASLLAND